jgi:hypothetical protein
VGRRTFVAPTQNLESGNPEALLPEVIEFGWEFGGVEVGVDGLIAEPDEVVVDGVDVPDPRLYPPGEKDKLGRLMGSFDFGQGVDVLIEGDVGTDVAGVLVGRGDGGDRVAPDEYLVGGEDLMGLLQFLSAEIFGFLGHLGAARKVLGGGRSGDRETDVPLKFGHSCQFVWGA